MELSKISKYLKYVGTSYEEMLIGMKQNVFDRLAGEELLNGEDSLLADVPKSHKEQLSTDRYAHIVIPNDEYKGKFQELNKAYWELQQEFQDQYDFGIVLLDLETIKK
jgi:hypothetical protein